MIVNRATGEMYSEAALGASIILVSTTSGIKRVLHYFDRNLFRRSKRHCGRLRTQPEDRVVPDLVRSLYLETKYLELHGQKIFVSF